MRFRSFLFQNYFLCIVIFTVFSSCGIYETTEALNPPFDHHITEIALQFTGDNSEDYFSGYVLWYKEDENEEYKVCVYEGRADIPTIPKDETSTVNTYTIDIKDLQPIDENSSFYMLKDDGRFFYFAVSSYGTNGEESEKVEFGRWPVY